MGVRDENRARTLTELQRATLDLVEEQGLTATTVTQIAERAGVSERTFFRYFATKEQAALPGQQGLAEGLREATLRSTEPREFIDELLAVCRDRFSFEVEHIEFRRISKLLATEPELQRALMQGEREQLNDWREELERRTELTPVQASLVAELANSVWRSTWGAVGRAEADGVEADPMDIFDEVVAEYRAITGHL